MSASRRAASTRRVTSSRLPIGVGQTIRRPALIGSPPSGPGRRTRAPPPRSSPPRPRTPPARSRRCPSTAGSARSATSARTGPRSSSPAPITPPPITTTSGLNVFTKLAIATPRLRPMVSIVSIAASSPSWASSVTSGPTSSRPSACARPRPESGRSWAIRSASRASAVPDASDSTQPWFGQFPWHGGPFRSITTCPSSAAGADCAAVELAAEDQPAADAGADREQDGLVATAGGAGAVLGDCRTVRVVVDEHRKIEPLGHYVGEHDVLEREVDGDHRVARPLID